MNTRNNFFNSRFTKMMFGALALIALGLAGPQRAQAQLPSSAIGDNYTFNDLPVVKTMPNPCTGGFVLITGEMDISIQTSRSASAFNLKVSYSSSGRGEDALASGTLLLDGTQKARYLYSSVMDTESDFLATPPFFQQEIVVTDHLVRESGDAKADDFVIGVAFEITFNNGVPTTPVLRRLETACLR